MNQVNHDDESRTGRRGIVRRRRRILLEGNWEIYQRAAEEETPGH